MYIYIYIVIVAAARRHGSRRGFEYLPGLGVQILHSGMYHWLCCSNRDGTARVFHSLNPRALPAYVQDALRRLFIRPGAEHTKLEIPDLWPFSFRSRSWATSTTQAVLSRRPQSYIQSQTSGNKPDWYCSEQIILLTKLVWPHVTINLVIANTLLTVLVYIYIRILLLSKAACEHCQSPME